MITHTELWTRQLLTLIIQQFVPTPQLPEATYKKAGYQGGWVGNFDIVNFTSLDPLLPEEYSRIIDPGKAPNNHNVTVIIMMSKA